MRLTTAAAFLATAALWVARASMPWAAGTLPPVALRPRHRLFARRRSLPVRVCGGAAALDAAPLQPQAAGLRQQDPMLALSWLDARWQWLRARRPAPLALGMAGILALGEKAAFASDAAAPAKLHLGQKLALMVKAHIALPDWAIVILLSAAPLVELRGGIPVGLWMGLPVLQVMLLCIIGNMLPIPFILIALRSPWVKKLFRPILSRAEKKTKAIGAHDRWVGIAAFVGVPLPGTGAWTGAMVAYLLGMDLREAFTSVLTGVAIAACIMASLTLAGWFGCALAVGLVCVALGSRYLPFSKQ